MQLVQDYHPRGLTYPAMTSYDKIPVGRLWSNFKTATTRTNLAPNKRKTCFLQNVPGINRSQSSLPLKTKEQTFTMIQRSKNA